MVSAFLIADAIPTRSRQTLIPTASRAGFGAYPARQSCDISIPVPIREAKAKRRFHRPILKQTVVVQVCYLSARMRMQGSL
eukprot:1663445-Rhodomonas_salina.1